MTGSMNQHVWHVGLFQELIAMTRQDEPGLKPGDPPLKGDNPFISQTAGVPSEFCHRMSALPSPLKSPAPMTCQAGPGLGPTEAPESLVSPSISQIAGWPSLPCHSM